MLTAHAITSVLWNNGPEFVSRVILRWLHTANIDTALNDPGKLWQNGADAVFQ